jgi:hypothetical protein
VPPPPQPAEDADSSDFRLNPFSKAVVGLLLVFLIGAVIIALAGGGGGEGASGGEGSGGDASEDAQGAAGEDQYSGEVETFTRENYGMLVANPDEHVGAEVDITGQLLDSPESQGNEVAFQMWADPVKVEWNTLVRTDQEALGLGSDAYVHVRGTVLGTFEGENAFGGAVNAVEVEADEVERAEAVDAIDPTIKTVEVGQTRSSEGFSVTLQRLEFGPRNTRAYVTARNDGYKAAKFDLDRSNIVQGSDRAGQTDPYDYNLPKPKPNLKPGEQTEGVVIFGRTDPSKPLQVTFAWERGGFTGGRTEPLVFEVAP